MEPKAIRCFSKRKISNTTFLVICCLLSSCAFSPVKRPEMESRTYEKTIMYDIGVVPLRKAVEQGLADSGYTVNRNNNDPSTIQTNVKKIQVNGLCDCGTWNGNTISREAGSELWLKIKEIQLGESKLQLTSAVTVRFQGRNLYGMVTRDKTFQCKSFGIIEDDFLEVLSARVAMIGKGLGKKTYLVDRDKEVPFAENSDDGTQKSKFGTKKQTSLISSEAIITQKLPENEKIKKLEAMKSLGLLTDEEFNKAANRIANE